MTLPDDYRRCYGHLPRQIGGFIPQWSTEHPCVDCLRRTSISERPNFMRSMEPPDFTTTCPERIAP